MITIEQFAAFVFRSGALRPTASERASERASGRPAKRAHFAPHKLSQRALSLMINCLPSESEVRGPV